MTGVFIASLLVYVCVMLTAILAFLGMIFDKMDES